MKTHTQTIQVIELVDKDKIYYADGFRDGKTNRYLDGMTTAFLDATDYSGVPEKLASHIAVLERSLTVPECKHDGMGITSYRVVTILITTTYQEITST